VRLSGSVAVCSSVRQCARLLACDSARGGVRQCVGLCVAVVFGSRHSSVCAMRAVHAAVCGSATSSVRQCVAVCGSASAWRSKRVVVVRSICMYIHKVAHNIYIPFEVNKPDIPCICIIFLQN
jgi:hypothetical protein